VALWSLFVEVGEQRYSAQVIADDPKGAVAAFLRSGGLRDTLANLSKGGWPREFTIDNVIYLVPMEGLINMHLCQLGVGGKYVSVVMARTESESHV
jgi:hypothetical protein